MSKISCEGIGTLRLGRDLERASDEAVVQISAGALPLEGTGASHILCHGCRNAGTGRGRLMEKQRLGLSKKIGGKIGSDCTRRLQVWQKSGVTGAAG